MRIFPVFTSEKFSKISMGLVYRVCITCGLLLVNRMIFKTLRMEKEQDPQRPSKAKGI